MGVARAEQGGARIREERVGTLLRAWVCPTRMRALEQIMERQKLMRMTERSERMYLEAKKSEEGEDEDPASLLREMAECSALPSLLPHSSASGRDVPPHRHVDDDEQQERERGHPAADDHRH